MKDVSELNDRELMELAAIAAGLNFTHGYTAKQGFLHFPARYEYDNCHFSSGGKFWNPLTDEGDRYRLIQTLGLCIDFDECTVWKRIKHSNDLIQEYWGGDCGDEAHAVLRVAAELGRMK